MAEVHHLNKTGCFRPDAVMVVTMPTEAVQDFTVDSLLLSSDAQLTSDANHQYSYYVAAILVIVREMAKHGHSDAAPTIDFDTNSGDEINFEALMGVSA